MNTQLLCTFTTTKGLDQTLTDIQKNFTIVFEKIYVLQNEDKNHELICTYNVEKNAQLDEHLIDAMSYLQLLLASQSASHFLGLRKRCAQLIS